MAWMYKHIPTTCFFLVVCYLTIKVVPILGEKAPHPQFQVEPKPNCQSSGPIIGSQRVSNRCSPNANLTKTPSAGKLPVNKNQARVRSINKKQNRHHYRYTLSDNEYDPNADYGLFTVKISLGSPRQYYSLIVDTGSRWTWVRCRFCSEGCSSDDPPYDPSKSLCDYTLTIPFNASYDDKSFVKGIWGCDNLTIDDFGSIMNFQFGCGLENYDGNGDNFVNAAGILGLGKGEWSLTSQSGASMQMFSYFVPENGGGADIQFGDKAREKSNTCTNQFTPMVQGIDQEKYFIDLVGISVNGNELNVPSTEFMSRGTIIDSGTIITRLPEVVYSAFRDAVRQSMSSYTLLDEIDELMDTCYSLEGLIEPIAFPEIIFHFGQENTIDVILTKEGTIWRKNGTLNCLAFAAAESYSIIGIVQQRGFNVLYDLEGKTIGFGTNCT
ncbi:aspartyl protease AED1-like [Solanum stenotomum]|uniref:aspartyl protease AED1-like n=1 Tax=Solanum stenotomum TaxID=172797 RepID=UPI0020D162B0|nr:aspartyl protease AED1-like [Solanum stenotomum]